MADSDNEYSDDDIVTGKGRAAASNPKRAHARWENLATKTHDLGDANGNIESVLGGIDEANKRRRYVARSIHSNRNTHGSCLYIDCSKTQHPYKEASSDTPSSSSTSPPP